MNFDLANPGILKVGYIKRRDGFFGLYRGLGPRMCATVIKGMAYQKATELFVLHVEGKQPKYIYHSLQTRSG